MTCPLCPKTFFSERGLCRHCILSHRHRYRRGRLPEYIVDDDEYERLRARLRRGQRRQNRLPTAAAAVAAPPVQLDQRVATSQAGERGSQIEQDRMRASPCRYVQRCHGEKSRPTAAATVAAPPVQLDPRVATSQASECGSQIDQDQTRASPCRSVNRVMEAPSTCPLCPKTFFSERGLCRHCILNHRHRYRRGRLPEYIVDDDKYERLRARLRHGKRRPKAAAAVAAPPVPLDQSIRRSRWTRVSAGPRWSSWTRVSAGPAGHHGSQIGQG